MHLKTSHHPKPLVLVTTGVIILLIVGTAPVEAEEEARAVPISILKLVVDCLPHHGKRVAVTGAVKLEFEDQSLCPTAEFFNGDPLNCLWLATDEVFSAEDLQNVSSTVREGSYVVIDGSVSCTEKGHFSLYGAELQGITLIVDSLRSRILWDATSGD